MNLPQFPISMSSLAEEDRSQILEQAIDQYFREYYEPMEEIIQDEQKSLRVFLLNVKTAQANFQTFAGGGTNIPEAIKSYIDLGTKFWQGIVDKVESRLK